MGLEQIQRALLGVIQQPLTNSEGMRKRTLDGKPVKKIVDAIIKPNERLTSFERLEIYNRVYWFRLLSSLADDYPGLRAVIGQRNFDKLLVAYLRDCPSESFTLRNLGSRLEPWLRDHPEFAPRRHPIAMDMVQLEWADIEAFDGRAEPALRPEDLSAGAGPDLRLKLQPYIQLLDLRYPVDDLLLGVRKDDEDTEFASNVFQERRKHKRVQAVAKLKPAEIYLVVHRVDYTVYFRRIDREEFLILSALRQGKPLGRAIENAFRKSSIARQERTLRVQAWFQHWAALGWFCRAEKKTKNR
jgi:hypothetical protein